MRIILIALCLLLVSCNKDIEKAVVGDTVRGVHVIDVVTGKCVRIYGYDYVSFSVVSPEVCKEK